MKTIDIFWFRRDLRIEDNAGLYHALNSNLPVLAVFIFDTNILNQLNKYDKRVSFIYNRVLKLKEIFEKNGSSLNVFYGTPLQFFEYAISKYAINAVFTNRDYEPYARERDQAVKKFLNSRGVSFHSFKDQVIFDCGEIAKDNNQPYTVFTPYSRKWKALLSVNHLSEFPSKKLLRNLIKITPFSMPLLNEIGFKTENPVVPGFDISEEKISNYSNTRDFPAQNGTSRLSAHLRFGTVSIRKVSKLAMKYSETFLSELIWRNFYMDILWHFPHVEKQSFKPVYDRIEWRNNEEEFEKWCKGETGYPLVDAGMRELNNTGYMHNRIRMVSASFLTKHLLVDWRWGEAYFAEKLLDFDLAANNGGWQWASGSGCDAVPYFRVFNPVLQAHKFDPENKYIRKWIPEFETPEYPPPMVDHKFARDRAITTYKGVLNQS